jgi:bifunctional non-homologous end joining protein LigD
MNRARTNARRGSVKGALRQSFAIVGYIPFFGARGKVGSLLLALSDEDGIYHFAGTVRMGFTGAMRVQLANLLEKDYVVSSPLVDAPALGNLERWAIPRHVADVEFTEWAHEGHVRHPTFRGLSESTEPNECIRKDAAPRDSETSFRPVAAVATEAATPPC